MTEKAKDRGRPAKAGPIELTQDRLDGVVGAQKVWLAQNFRFKIGDLPAE